MGRIKKYDKEYIERLERRYSDTPNMEKQLEYIEELISDTFGRTNRVEVLDVAEKQMLVVEGNILNTYRIALMNRINYIKYKKLEYIKNR